MKISILIYWVATIWFSLGMLTSAVVQLIKLPQEVNMITNLGYPIYFLTILGVWKILGVIVLLVPRIPLLKEWAYAGFFFAMTGALFSHIVSSGISIIDIFPSLLLLLLLIISWYLRPLTRKIPSLN